MEGMRELLDSIHGENRGTGKEGEADHRCHKHNPRKMKKWRHVCRLLGTNSLKEGAMRHIHQLLCCDRETSYETTAITRQQLRKYASVQSQQ
jgi:hypothetical protein